MRVFKNIPFLRICVPFIVGILLALQFSIGHINTLVLIVVLLIALIFPFLPRQTTFTKTTFLLCTDLFIFCFAVNLTSTSRLNARQNYYGNLISTEGSTKLIVIVNDLPVEKENLSVIDAGFVKCDLKILEVKKDSQYVKAEGKLIGYFKKPYKQLRFGQTLLINTKLIEIEPPKNPLEFNYKTYLENKQIFHTVFMDSASVALIDAPSNLSAIWSLGLKTKRFVLSRLKNSELSHQAYAICAALLTGYDDEIDQSVMEAFSHSGTLHVLSVSGLHTGLIYLVLAFLFDLFDRKKKYRLLKFIFITLSLWFFALITGFSAPVLRAVIMFNLLGLGKIFFRNNYRNQINILLVSAFMLLCYDPFLITDIGFQLSYTALFGILFFQPVFSNLWEPESKFVKYIWQSITASFAATISTLPFTLFYFKQFPIWFFICNLVVVPATFIVLMLAVLVVIKIGKISLLINFIIKCLIGFINLFNTPDLGFIDNIDFDWFDAILLSILVMAFSSAFYYRSYKYLVYAFVLLIFWQINGIIFSYQYKEQKLFAVYQVKKAPAYCVKNKRDVLMNELNRPDFLYHVKPHLVSFNYPRMKNNSFNFLQIDKNNILILNKDNFWPQVDKNTVSTLVVSNNFKISERDLEEFGNLKLLVADGSNTNYALKQLEKICGKFDVEFYSTKNKGAYILNL